MYRYFGISVIVCIIVGIALLGGIKNEKTEERINGAKEVEVIESIKAEESISNLENQEINSEVIVESVAEQEKSISNNEVKEKELVETKISNNQVITEEREVNNNQVTSESKEPIEEIIKEVDLEYEGLKNLCETFDYNECYKKASEISSTDIVNIRNTSCEDVIYKGQIIGQRIIIFYRDGTWKYNNATN